MVYELETATSEPQNMGDAMLNSTDTPVLENDVELDKVEGPLAQLLSKFLKSTRTDYNATRPQVRTLEISRRMIPKHVPALREYREKGSQVIFL